MIIKNKLYRTFTLKCDSDGTVLCWIRYCHLQPDMRKCRLRTSPSHASSWNKPCHVNHVSFWQEIWSRCYKYKKTFIIRRVKNPYVQNLFRISTEEIHGWHNSWLICCLPRYDTVQLGRKALMFQKNQLPPSLHSDSFLPWRSRQNVPLKPW